MPIKWNPMGDGLQKWPMSAISKGRRRENPITAYIPGTGGFRSSQLTLRADPYWRERETHPPDQPIKSQHPSRMRSLRWTPLPPPNHSTVGYGVLYHWILFEPPTVHLKFPIFSTIKPERFFAKLKFSRNEHIVFASFHNFLMYNISSKIAVLYAAPNVRVDEK